MADGRVDLTKDSLVTVEGVNELNRMIKFLFDNVFGDGDQVRWFSGYGSPESVVVAKVGSFYSRLDGGASTTLYVKTSGSGATGWTAK